MHFQLFCVYYHYILLLLLLILLFPAYFGPFGAIVREKTDAKLYKTKYLIGNIKTSLQCLIQQYHETDCKQSHYSFTTKVMQIKNFHFHLYQFCREDVHMYVYISFKTYFYVVRHLDSIASYLPTGLHLGFFCSWPSLFFPASFSSVFLVLSFVLASTEKIQ